MMDNRLPEKARAYPVFIYVMRDILILLMIGGLYYLIVTRTGFALPCYYKTLFGMQCGTCGVTRMMVSSAHLDFDRAFHYNPVVFVTFPALVVEIIYLFYKMEKRQKLPVWNSVLIYTYLGMLVVYGIVRNL